MKSKGTLRRTELPAPGKDEVNPFLTDDGQLKPGIVVPVTESEKVSISIQGKIKSKCPVCRGIEWDVEVKSVSINQLKCPFCEGNGRDVLIEDQRCHICEGSGEINIQVTVE